MSETTEMYTIFVGVCVYFSWFTIGGVFVLSKIDGSRILDVNYCKLDRFLKKPTCFCYWCSMSTHLTTVCFLKMSLSIDL